jgi:hypothetical protein
MSCLCFPQFCSTRAELVYNPHHHSPGSTVIGPRLSAWICQPFCCQRTFALIPSERFSIPLKHCPIFRPNNKKPGVERRVHTPVTSGASTRSSTQCYPVLVKNLTIGSTSGLRLILLWEDASFDPTVTPLQAQLPPSHLQVYKKPRIRQAPLGKLFSPFLCLSVKNVDGATSARSQSTFDGIQSGREGLTIA